MSLFPIKIYIFEVFSRATTPGSYPVRSVLDLISEGMISYQSTNYIIRVTLITESDTVFLYPPYTKIAKSEVLNFGVPS